MQADKDLKLQNMRKEFGSQLDYQLELPENPFVAFQAWFSEAQKFYKEEANCFVLSTADKEGLVSSRVVLLKGFQEESFRFFTNYQSDKAKAIEENASVSCLFYWSSLEKQIRFQAKATKIDPEISQQYFSTRPRNSQLAAWASKQSSKIKSKRSLVEGFLEEKEKYMETESIPCPKFWGGYKLEPFTFEFWQGGLYRLHDRIRYKKEGKVWLQERLSP